MTDRICLFLDFAFPVAKIPTNVLMNTFMQAINIFFNKSNVIKYFRRNIALCLTKYII